MSNEEAPSRVPWPPLMLLASLAGGLGMHYFRPVAIWDGGGVYFLRTAGWLVLALSFLCTGMAHQAMRRAKTTIRPDRASSSLVTDGPFGTSRNPLYLSQCAALTGLAMVTNSLWLLLAMILLWMGLNWFVIPREERYLQRLFPEPFGKYRARVRRWL